MMVQEEKIPMEINEVLFRKVRKTEKKSIFFQHFGCRNENNGPNAECHTSLSSLFNSPFIGIKI